MLRRPPLCYPNQPFHQFLHNAAERCPERVALTFDSDSYTFRELDACSTALANALLGRGVVPGERVLLLLSNRPEWVIALLAASQAGCAVVLANPNWKPAEIAHALELTHPAVVVADETTAGVVDALGYPRVRVCADENRPPGWLSLWELVYSSPARRPEVTVADWGGLDAVLPFSSGTTGLPKAVRHTHRSLVAATVAWQAASTIDARDRLQLFLPLFHVYGVVTLACAIAAGAPLRLFRRFDLDAVLANIEAERITVGFGAAPVAVAMANHPELERYDLSSLRYLVWGATPVTPEIATGITERTGVRWLAAYGATEAPVLHCNPVGHPDRWRLDSPGLPLSDVAVSVVDLETRQPVEPGGTGEVLVRGPQVMAGYLPSESDVDAFENGWLRTGDIGWVESQGWLHLTDRAKEMVKVNAFQVAPAELEQVLFGHPAVADCAVYGMPDERTGEAPHAAVVLREDTTASSAELQDWVADRVATYKRLRQVRFVTELPRTASGKILRRLLRT